MKSLRSFLAITTLISIGLLALSASSPEVGMAGYHRRTPSPQHGHDSGCGNENNPFTAPAQTAPSNGKQCVELRIDTAPESSFTSNPENEPLVPHASVSLRLDDGLADNAIGVGYDDVAVQFLWLNRFTPSPSAFPFSLEQIWVLFEFDGIKVGDAIDLVVYQDLDGNPPNNAAWMATYHKVIKAIDGSTWSVYSLNPPVQLNGPGDVLIGVINRFVNSGVSPWSFPASIDETSSKRRSWRGWWYSDPPDPPILPPDEKWGLIDDYSPGNWMIRGYGETISSMVFLPILTKRYFAYFEGPDEIEPNNDWQHANGPIRAGKKYYGYPDEKDYFSFIASESGSIVVDLTNHTGQGVQLQLFHQDTSNRVAWDYAAPFHIELTNQPPGRYYIYIYSKSGYNQENRYTLKANYP